MQVTPGEQTRDTITVVGRNTGYKKKNTLLIRKDNTVSFRGNSHRDAQQPAISAPGCSASPETAVIQLPLLQRRCLTIPSLVVFQLLHRFFFFFSSCSYITGEEMDSPADATEVSLVCATGVCKLDACVAKRNTGILGLWRLEEHTWSKISTWRRTIRVRVLLKRCGSFTVNHRLFVIRSQ